MRRISFPDMAALANGKADAKPKTYLFAVAADRAKGEAEVSNFETTLLWSLSALGLFLTVATLLQVRVGLRPLAVVRERLQAIRTGRAPS